MIKRKIFILWWTVCSIVSVYAANGPVRETINFNRDWRYICGDPLRAEQPDFSEEHWEKIGLPHSFSMPYFMSKDFYTGYGWYRKGFVLEAKDLERKLFLEFDGVFQEAEIYVNGVKAGAHIGGYTGFSVDITSLVQAGDNVVAVRVNNLWKPDVAPRAGEHVFSGGIYRNVRLVKKSPVYIDWYGTFVTTPGLSESGGKCAAVQVRTDICNHTAQAVEYKLVTEVREKGGKLLASVTRKEKIAAHSSKQCEQLTKEIQNLRLWHPTHPHLYKVVSLLYKGKKLVDRTETTFGFRWIEWTADQGFFLNGKHFYFHGANVHQDQAGWGDAVTEAAMRRDVNMMKEAGFDFLRGSHYPHSPAFSTACDELGMLFWSETVFWGIGGFKSDGYWDSSAYPVRKEDEAAFEESALQQLEEMIRIHRNHPSIIVWSMCNEAFFSAPEAMPGVRRLLKRMVELTHRLDPTRPAAVGGAQRPLGDGRIDLLGDVAGYNGDGATLLDFQQPGVPNIVAEYGSVTAERPGEYAPGWGDLGKDEGWKERPWRSGQAIWCGFDHGSIAGSTLGKMGIVDYFRIPKRSWYWYRNEYRQIPPPAWPAEGTAARLALEATKTVGVLADGTDDVQLTVSVLNAAGERLSNSPPVKLTVISGPGEFPTGRSILFEKDSDIRILDGQAAIGFRSYYAGKAIVEATSPGLSPARVEICFEGAPAYEPGITPPVAERPYVRFMRAAPAEEDVLQLFGRNNPTFASSRKGTHSAGLAADGNDDTFWQAADGDKSPWWSVDTEKGLVLSHIRVRFPKKEAYRYVVEVSDDNKRWTVVKDRQNTVEASRQVEVTFAGREKPVTARYVRIRFAENSPAAVAEVEVGGRVRE